MKTPSITTTELYTHLDTLISADIPVFIHGSPGIGKSYIVAEVAKKHSLTLVDVRLSQMDPVDLRGVPAIRDEQTVWMAPVFFPRDKESSGILFLDELNSAPPSVQAAIYQLVLNRKMGEYELPHGWRIICAGNRISDRGVVFRLPTPLANRMVHLSVEARFEDFKLFAIREALHQFVIGFLGFRPDLLTSEPVSEDDSNPAFATPRSYHMLSNVLKTSSDTSKIAPIIYGLIGYGAGIEFLSYVKVYEKLPDVQAIYRGEYPNIDKSEPALLYALVSAMVELYRGGEEASKHLFAFAQILPTEFGVMLIKDAIVKDASIAECSEFDAWIERYGDYIL
ncbi:ATP-binding protein [Sulfuricurvum sp.]|uniref:ATP-binding protein n=1 Tax=Sulfuricurvum sp. TaxID=2025608 RepID=UPI00262B3427|nr:MoxR family ATPase [Sulfuricurvum sp.]MDD2267306.1 MoxR family ATPase [Sulfuricurvum sp.]MDD2783928.1 MoxR family ATPase [Sulfuricurvum sp.]HZF70432.1 MoxR family ATPase [Sulfuricurvum sp.]